MRERLFDFTSVLVHQNAPRQTFLSTGAYLFQTSSGVLIPLEAFDSFSKKNDTLSQYLSRPTLNLTMIDELINKDKVISEKKKKKLIVKLKIKVNVKPADAEAYWTKKKSISYYGPYCTTYAAMSARYAAAKAQRRVNERVRVKNMSAAEKEERRLRINANRTRTLRLRKAKKDAQRFKLVRSLGLKRRDKRTIALEPRTSGEAEQRR